MQQRVLRFTRSAEGGLRRLNMGFKKLSSGIKKFGLGLAAGAAAATTSIWSLSQSGMDFEQAITNVGATALKTREEIAPLEDLAKKLGATTEFTATQSANAMEILTRAGFEMNEVIDATPAVLSAASASGLEIAEVAGHVSNVLKGMGLEMNQASKVADVLALASAKTNSSIGSLGESMKNVSATARQLNVPIEEAVASVALLQDVGLDASVAGSAFNTMLTNMAKPAPKVQRQMRRFGVSFKDTAGNMLPLQKVLEQLNIASEKAGGNFDQVAFFADLVGLRGQKAASNLSDLFKKGKVEDLVKELRKALGTSEKMAALRMDTTTGSLTLLGSAVDAVKVKLFDMNSGPLKQTIDDLTKWVGKNEDVIATGISEFISDLITNLPEIWKWIKRIGIGLAVFFTLNAILNTLVATLTLVNLVMAANPITLIVLGIMAAVAAFTALVFWIDEAAEFFDSLGPVVRALLTPFELLIDAIKFIKDNWDSVEKIHGIAVSNVSGAMDSVANFFSGDDDEEEVGGVRKNVQEEARAGIVSPQERVARNIEERRETSTSELLVRTAPGVEGEMVRQPKGGRVKLERSGEF
jgi:TP901 family phage tail tape measure protein